MNDFTNVEVLKRVRETLQELLFRLDDFYNNMFMQINLSDINSLFRKFAKECVNYSKTESYRLLEEYNKEYAKYSVFRYMDKKFFIAMRKRNISVNDFFMIDKSLKNTISSIKHEIMMIEEFYSQNIKLFNN